MTPKLRNVLGVHIPLVKLINLLHISHCMNVNQFVSICFLKVLVESNISNEEYVIGVQVEDRGITEAI